MDIISEASGFKGCVLEVSLAHNFVDLKDSITYIYIQKVNSTKKNNPKNILVLHLCNCHNKI